MFNQTGEWRSSRTAVQDFTLDRVMDDGRTISDADRVLTCTFSECHCPAGQADAVLSVHLIVRFLTAEARTPHCI